MRTASWSARQELPSSNSTAAYPVAAWYSRNPSARFATLEVLVHNRTAVTPPIFFAPVTALGLYPVDGTQFAQDDPGDPPSSVWGATVFGTNPTVALSAATSPETRKTNMALSTLGGSALWTFPRGILCPAGLGHSVWSVTSGSILSSDISVTVAE